MVNFPTSVSTNSNLYIAVNGLQTTLALAINASVTTITLTSTSSFPTTGLVTINNLEVVSYTGISGSDLTGCTRGADGTTAVSHNAGVTVGATVVAAHHNLLKDEVIAVETALGTGYSTTTRGFLDDLNNVVVPTPVANDLLTFNGTNWVNVASSTFGVTSITGTANQVIASSPSGVVTLSTPQNIHSGASPTFDSQTLGGTSGIVITGATTTEYWQTAGTTMYLGNNRSAAGVIPSAGNPTAAIGILCPSGPASIALATSATNNTAPATVVTVTNAAVTVAAPLAMSANKITGLANGTALTDAAAFGQLKVVQIVNATATSATTTTSTTYTNTNLTATITPTSASNKIYMIVSGNVNLSSTTPNLRAFITVYAAGADLNSHDQGFQTVANVVSSASSAVIYPINIAYLDSLPSTAARTYTVHERVDSAGLSVAWGQSGNGTNLTTTITLMEVVA